MADPAFLFGIGAAKAGTTWLAQALRAHPQAVLPPFKEAHYFDSLENGTSMWAMDQLISVRMGVRADLASAGTEKMRKRLSEKLKEMDRWLALVGAQIENDTRYEALMRRPARTQTRVCADITPAYALLSEATLARMEAMNGGNTRFVMVLRDPVDRLWSNLSMVAARRCERGRSFDVVQEELLRGIRDGSSADELARSDYAGTLARLTKTVPAEKRMVVFFEDLFKAETLAELSEFLGLDGTVEGPKRAKNVGAGRSMEPVAHRLLADAMQPQYEFVMSKFDAIPTRWQENMKGPVQ